MRVPPATGSIGDPAVLGFVGDVPVQQLECIHDVVEAHNWCRRWLAQTWGGLDCASVRGPRREDRPLLLNCHIRVGSNIHRALKNAGWMKEVVEFKVLSIQLLGHGYIPGSAT
jgi:hypothetical protein